VQEAMYYVGELGHDQTLLFLDFEKVYDYISWSFVKEVLKKQEFH